MTSKLFFSFTLIGSMLMVAACGTTKKEKEEYSASTLSQPLIPEFALQVDASGDSPSTGLDLLGYGKRTEAFSPSDIASIDATYPCDRGLAVCAGKALPSGNLVVAQSRFASKVPLQDKASGHHYSVSFGNGTPDRWYVLRWDASAQTWRLEAKQKSGGSMQVTASAARALIDGDTITWLIPTAEVGARSTTQHDSFAPSGKDSSSS